MKFNNYSLKIRWYYSVELLDFQQHRLYINGLGTVILIQTVSLLLCNRSELYAFNVHSWLLCRVNNSFTYVENLLFVRFIHFFAILFPLFNRNVCKRFISMTITNSYIFFQSFRFLFTFSLVTNKLSRCQGKLLRTWHFPAPTKLFFTLFRLQFSCWFSYNRQQFAQLIKELTSTIDFSLWCKRSGLISWKCSVCKVKELTTQSFCVW